MILGYVFWQKYCHKIRHIKLSWNLFNRFKVWQVILFLKKIHFLARFYIWFTNSYYLQLHFVLLYIFTSNLSFFRVLQADYKRNLFLIPHIFKELLLVHSYLKLSRLLRIPEGNTWWQYVVRFFCSFFKLWGKRKECFQNICYYST